MIRIKILCSILTRRSDIHGMSGPYVQYAATRAKSILAKAPQKYRATAVLKKRPQAAICRKTKKSILRMLCRFPEVVASSLHDFAPHYLCLYLFELSQLWNAFYNENRIIGSEREPERIFLTKAIAQVLENGLGLLGIAAPEKNVMTLFTMLPATTIAENRRARFDYEIKEKFEAGIELKGYEVKSAKGGTFPDRGSAGPCSRRRSMARKFPYPAVSTEEYARGLCRGPRAKTAAHEKEIKTITGMLQDKGQRLIPLRAYLKNGFIKLELGLGRIRKKSDKREVLKKRAHVREMRSL